MFFTNRRVAGRRLAARLARYRPLRPLIVALPPGGVAVAHEVAAALGAPLDALVVEPVTAPDDPEALIGAVTPDTTILDGEAIAAFAVSSHDIVRESLRARAAVSDRLAACRRAVDATAVAQRTVILVADGIRRSADVVAAAETARRLGAERVIVATPVSAPEAIRVVRAATDEFVYLAAPTDFHSIEYWYSDDGGTDLPAIRRLLAVEAAPS